MRISVVIPTFNAGRQISDLIERLRAQVPRPPDEILAIDSGSTDDTCDRVRAAGGRVIDWRQPFNHGLTRDAGIAECKGEIVCLTVQDALPASGEWLARVSAHFSDPKVAGVTTRQIPPDDGPVELKIKAQLDANQPVTRIDLADHPQYQSYAPAQRIELYRFDNVCSALRRSVWEKIPFGPCRYAEDYQWARRVLESGFAIVRDPGAPVIHAHRRSFWYELRRGLLDAWVLDEAFGYRYGFLDRLNRVQHLVRPPAPNGGAAGASAGERFGALKTYSAHALARGMYSGYRLIGRPLGIGRGTLEYLTRGI